MKVSPYQFTMLRLGFAIFLLFQFSAWMSFAGELFPVFFPFSAHLLSFGACVLCSLLAVGWKRRWVSAGLLVFLVAALVGNSFLWSPITPSLAFLLLGFLWAPPGEPLAWGEPKTWRQVPSAYIGLAYGVLVGSSISLAPIGWGYGWTLPILLLLFVWGNGWFCRVSKTKPIVFFDGNCVLCNGSVDVLFEMDTEKKLKVAPLQSELARKLLPPVEEMSTIRVWDQGKIYERSDAILRILFRLGGVWRLGSLFWVIPPFIRDGIYGFIAKNRIAWFGSREICRMASEDDRERFAE